jgi:sigma54-dependent transcription regulator
MLDLRTKLLSALTTQFSNERENAIDRLKDGIALFTRYVRRECERTGKATSTLARLRQYISELRARIQAVGLR